MIDVLLVDDSSTVRRRMVHLFNVTSDFRVIGQVGTGAEVAAFLQHQRPHLVCLDVFLANEQASDVVHTIRSVWKGPIVLVSDAPRASPEVFNALAAGAMDIVNKPPTGNVSAVAEFLQQMRRLSELSGSVSDVSVPRFRSASHIVTIGCSTGGPGALRDLLSRLPKNFPWPVVVAQHLAPGFEEDFASWLSSACPLKVEVAPMQALIQPGKILLGRPAHDVLVSSETHLQQVKRSQQGFHPSVDALLSSSAKAFGARVVSIVLSGIGSDGAKGAQDVAASGGVVMAQDVASAVVSSMPVAVQRSVEKCIIGPPGYLVAQVLRLALSSVGEFTHSSDGE